LKFFEQTITILISNDQEAKISSETLMTWPILVSGFPWGVVLLLGGGFAIANGAEVSGLSDWVGEQLESLQSLPHPLILFIILLVLSILTEFT
jgi:di/tricarboxylate transporter